MRRRVLQPWVLTALLSAAYVLWTPATGDFAAQAYRTGLAEQGVWIWDAGWFGGHHLPSYSVLFPALGALIGTAAAGGVAATIGTAAFTALVRAHRPGRGAELAAWWFAVGSAAMLTTGRLTFQLGVAIGLVALMVAARARPAGPAPAAGLARPAGPAPAAGLARPAGPAPAAGLTRPAGPAPAAGPVRTAGPVRNAGPARTASVASPVRSALVVLLALATPLASPVAALFLGFAGVVWCLDRRSFRGLPVLVALVPVAAAVVLTLAFPNGGSQPFATWELLVAAAAMAAVVVVLPADERALRIGAALYLVGIVLAGLLTTPMGSNAPRLGTLLAGPVVAAVLWDRRRVALAVVVVPLLAWQLYSPIQQTIRAAGDDTTGRGFYAPLIDQLRPRLSAEPSRVEVPPTARRGEARWLPPSIPLARGWIRQLDGERNALFYADGPLRPDVYRAWLDEHAVGWVALPKAPADVRSKAEGALLRSGRVPGLRRVWADAHWTLWRVVGGRPLASWRAAASAEDEDPPTTGDGARTAGGESRAPASGAAPRVAAMTSDRVVVEVPRAGLVDLRIRWSPYLRVRRGDACLAEAADGWTTIRTFTRATVVVGVRLGAPWRAAAPADCRAS